MVRANMRSLVRRAIIATFIDGIGDRHTAEITADEFSSRIFPARIPSDWILKGAAMNVKVYDTISGALDSEGDAYVDTDGGLLYLFLDGSIHTFRLSAHPRSRLEVSGVIDDTGEIALDSSLFVRQSGDPGPTLEAQDGITARYRK